jgi:hypothetical protein
LFRKLLHRLGGTSILSFFSLPVKYNYHFCYINCNKNYIINCVEKLFSEGKTIMFANQEQFTIHKSNAYCGPLNNKNLTSNTSNMILTECNDLVTHSYPKNKILPIIIKTLTNHNMINKDLFFNTFPNIHIVDFLSFINNKFGKTENTENNMIKLCKYLNNNQIKFPKISIKNPVARKLLL